MNNNECHLLLFASFSGTVYQYRVSVLCISTVYHTVSVCFNIINNNRPGPVGPGGK